MDKRVPFSIKGLRGAGFPERVPYLGLRLLVPSSLPWLFAGCPPTSDILGVGYRFEVVWVDTTPDPAFVVQFEGLWDWSDISLIGQDVGADCLAAAFAVRNFDIGIAGVCQLAFP
jgi:hypothetical protein